MIYGDNYPASYRTNFDTTLFYPTFGFRPSLYKDVALDPDSDAPGTGSDPVIVDVVDPVWKVENINIDSTNKKVTADVIATDKYLTGTSNSTLTTNDITVSVDGDTNANTAITKTLSDPTFSENATTGLKEIKYTLTLSNWEEASKQSGKNYLEWSGTTKITIAEGTVTDDATGVSGAISDGQSNSSKEQEFTLGHVDFIKPRIEKVSSTKDTATKTETIIFNVIDKYLDTSDAVADSEITVYVDGETATLTKALSRVTANDVSATINGTSQVVSQQYQLVLSGFEQATNNAKGYKDWSGTVSIDIAENAVKDTSNNTLDSDAAQRTITGDYVDFIDPNITYQYLTSDIDKAGKSFQMAFEVTDKYYTSGKLTINDLTITMDDGKNTYNLKNTPVEITLNSDEAVTASNVKMTNASTGNVETVATTTIGHKYVLTISNLEQLEIANGNTTLDYSGIVTVAVAADKVVDRSGNKNIDKTITSGVDIPDETGDKVVVDVVKPIWRRTTGGTVDLTNNTATLVVKGTDTYYASNSLTASGIKVYGYTGTVESDITSSVTKTLSTATTLSESVTVNGTTSSRNYGVQYTITLEGLPLDKSQVKVVIPAATLTDNSGNVSESYEMIVYTTLKSTSSETTATSAFLGNADLERQNIESVTFVNSTSGAASNKWDVSAAGDNSIIAWYTGTGPYQVVIASDEFMCANQDSGYLFSYIGYATSCTATSVINGLNVLNTTIATKMNYMFQYCGYEAMTSLDLGTNFDTRNVINMSSMFCSTGYRVMERLNLGDKFDTSNVTDMSSMFAATGFMAMTSLDLSSGTTATNTTQFNTSSVTNMSSMFNNCGKTAMASLNLGNNFDTTEVTDMKYMFFNCGRMAMTSLSLGANFDTSEVTNMEYMFYGCGFTVMTSLNLGEKFDTSKVTNMSSMFQDCGRVAMTSLDLGDKFDTSNVTNMNSMFYGCGNIAMITLDLGPAFTKIADTNTDFMTDCGTSELVVYAPESIYSNRGAFKLNKAGQ